MPTPLYLNGFENRVLAVGGSTTDGMFNIVTLTQVTATIDSTIFRGAGLRALKLAINGGVASQGLFRVTHAAQTLYAGRFYFRKSANPSQANFYLFSIGMGASTFFLVTLRTDGALEIRASGGTSPTNGSTTAVLSNDTWYLVDFTIDCSTTSYVARLWLDEVQATTDATLTGAAAGSISQPDFGKPQSGTTTALNIYYDDVIFGTAADLDDRFGPTDGIVGLVPNADGTHSPSPPTAGRFKDAGNTDISGGNPAYDNVDSGDLTQVAEYVSQDTAGSTDYLEVAFGTTTLSAAAPIAVQGEVSLDSDHASVNAFSASTRMRNGGSETVLFTGDWSTGSQWWKRALISVADQSELDGLTMRFGYGSAQPAIPYWTALMFEVDIGVAAAPPESHPIKNMKIYSDAVRRASRW
jgi:hypothetical protein